MSSKLKEKVKVYLALRSGGVCAHPEYQVRLTENPAGEDQGAIIGEAAHIFGEKPGSARYDPIISIEFLSSAENLIYLCPTHHTLIDKQRKTHTVAKLFYWKTDHENKMREATTAPSVEVTYDEIQIVTGSLSRTILLQEVQEARKAEEHLDVIKNGLEENLDLLTTTLTELGEIDKDVRRRVLGYSRWYEPASKDEIFQKLAVFGHERELVAFNARRLQDDGLIQITENHYLPWNEEVCQQAAESLMAEILRELEK